MTLTVSGVEDLVGNTLLRPVIWQFEVEKAKCAMVEFGGPIGGAMSFTVNKLTE